MVNKIYAKIKTFFKENYKFLIFLVFLIFLFYYEFPYIIYKSGGTIDLDKRVIIDKDYEQKGSLSMSYVTAMKGTAPFILLSYILPDWDLNPLEDVTDEESYEDILKVGKEYMNEGIDNAIIAAFRESNYNINITKEIQKVAYITEKAHTDIEIGDEILKVDDIEVNSIEDVQKYINTLNAGDEVKVYVKKDDKEKTRKAIIYKEEDDTLKIGIAFKTLYEYETEIPVSVKMKNNESGSSGGLMMSLAIYNALTKEDITKGYNIVGTGSITSEGIVEEIGGVKYKILAAEKKKADIFLCPEENYAEAKKIKDKRKLKIKLVKVHTLKEAIDYLDDLTPKK